MAVISFKCPHCDGELIFDPTTQKHKCVYCKSLFAKEELEELQPAVGEESKSFEEAPSQGEAVSYSCPSCGAQIITDATTAATFCYYCHNPVVLGKRLTGSYLPDKVIPFQFDKEVAEKHFLNYVGKMKFVPKAFSNKKQIECLCGVYFPYWLYNVKLEGSMDAEGKTVRVWETSREQHMETKVYHVKRKGEVELNNLPENALSKANSQLALAVMPYNFKAMQDFQMSYLSGFFAERRDIELPSVKGKMQGMMRQQGEKIIRTTMSGYDSVRVQNSDFKALQEEWSYVLLPVWTVTYRGKNGKIYYYSMNGQTGTIYGEFPIDYKKITLISMITALAMLPVVLYFCYFMV